MSTRPTNYEWILLSIGFIETVVKSIMMIRNFLAGKAKGVGPVIWDKEVLFFSVL